jgi:hypothetical protein
MRWRGEDKEKRARGSDAAFAYAAKERYAFFSRQQARRPRRRRCPAAPCRHALMRPASCHLNGPNGYAVVELNLIELNMHAPMIEKVAAKKE